jgi:hypothetical protein
VRPFSAALGGALAFACALAVANAADAPSAPNTPSASPSSAPAIPVGVKIPVVLTMQLSSGTAHVGDLFTFKTAKNETLGSVAVPRGTIGSGRVAVVTPAQGKQHGSLALQADSLTLASGETIWVNIDPSAPLTGKLSDKHIRYYVIPLPIGFVPGAFVTASGNIVIDSGSPFRVVTIAPRKGPAPLMTAQPTAAPVATPSAPSATSAPSPAKT